MLEVNVLSSSKQDTETDIPEDVHILFADNDDKSLKNLEIQAKKLRWTGEYVSSATQIINAVNINCVNSHKRYDCVVADINYWNPDDGPRLTGITAARLIRKVRPDVPILFISEHVNSVIREEVRRIGDAEIFAKPFNIDKLFRRISQLIIWDRLTNQGLNVIEDRRHNSINRSEESRRSTDQMITVPERIQTIIQEAIIKEEEDNNERITRTRST